jgi:hypothetical protein
MMKRPYFAAFIFFSLFLLEACTQRSSEDIPIYHAPAPMPSMDEYMETAITQTQETDINYEPHNPPYDVGFTGVITEEIEHYYGNSNYYAFMDSKDIYFLDNGYGFTQGFCHNKETDTLYYVNLEKGNNLYSYHDGVSTLLIDQYVNYPNYKDGSIYFLSNENPSKLFQLRDDTQGKLYRYGLEDGQIELILDQYIWDLRICDDYFYFSNSKSYDENGEKRPLLHYRMRIGDQKPEETDLLPFFYGEYQLQFIPSSKYEMYGALALTNGKQSIPLVGESDRNDYRYYCIDDSKLWIKLIVPNSPTKLISIELSNGEVTEYPLVTQNRTNDEKEIYSLETFTVLDGVIYTISKGMLCYYDTEKMALVPLPEILVTVDSLLYNYMKSLYSDGESLFSYNSILGFVYKTTPQEDGTFTQESIGDFVSGIFEPKERIEIDRWLR